MNVFVDWTGPVGRGSTLLRSQEGTKRGSKDGGDRKEGSVDLHLLLNAHHSISFPVTSVLPPHNNIMWTSYDCPRLSKAK